MFFCSSASGVNMPFDILEEPICYTTFLTKNETSQRLKRCTRCRCAWYRSADEQRANWLVHKEVCQRPDYDRIADMTAAECIEELKQQGSFLHNCNHNTSSLLERLFDIIRHDSDAWTGRGDADSNKDMRRVLHAFSRTSLEEGDAKDDILEQYYQRVWACPGMPQLLHFTDMKSSSLRKMMKNFPNGRPIFGDIDKENNFELQYNTDFDESGEHVAWFVVGFLVRSCVWGKITKQSNDDGRGHLRDTYYSQAARRHLARIFSSKTLRDCAKKAFYPVPGYILNVAENNTEEFLTLLNAGVGLGVLNWADLGYAKRTLRIMSIMDLSDLYLDAKLDILEWSCNMSGTKHAFYPWHSTCENQDKDIVKLLIKIAVNIMLSCEDLTDLLEAGINRRPELLGPQWIEMMRDRRRIVFVFLHEKLADVPRSDLKEVYIAKLLEQFGNFQMHERLKYAKLTLEENRYEIYQKQAEKLREMLKNRLKEKMKKKTGEIRGVHIGVGCPGKAFPFPIFPGLMGGSVWR